MSDIDEARAVLSVALGRYFNASGVVLLKAVEDEIFVYLSNLVDDAPDVDE